MSDFKHKPYPIEDFIQIVRDKRDRSAKYDRNFLYDVYGKEEDDDRLHVGQYIFVSDTVQVNDDDEEIYPDDVKENGLTFLYSGENFQAVVDLAVKQKPAASPAEIIRCLNHYAEKDDFLDLQ
ncbi:hypothetical protein GIY62_35420 (plasmid) [Burkholderia plantarii]|uniref:DUF7716 domain-containing protein n=1 Tax=Burkholderia plantarii TaxID=41899 RepID=UPI00272B0325|nr:hypothetical protein [Burkholderia plantarii]WLE64151.1 hypothetical protein GIY62_35420 [Burkholderia plantarii]